MLVTGGAGFIGSNLIEKFLEQDNYITCLDNLSTGRMDNIFGFLDHPRFNFLKGDIRSLDDCRNAVHGSEIVLHQAALGSVPRSINDPITSNDVNVGGFLNMLVSSKRWWN